MSLINQVLNDLDGRQASLKGADGKPLSDLQAANGIHRSNRSLKIRMGIVLLVLFVGLLVWILTGQGIPLQWSETEPGESLLPLDQSPKIIATPRPESAPDAGVEPQPEVVVTEFEAMEAVVPEVPVSPEERIDASTPFVMDLTIAAVRPEAKLTESESTASPPPTAEADRGADAPAERIEISDLTITEHDGRIGIAMELNGTPEYKVYVLTTPHRAVLDLVNAQLTGELPRDFGEHLLLANVRVRESDGNELKFVFDLNDAVRVERADLLTGAQNTRLAIDLVHETAVTSDVQTIESQRKPRLLSYADDSPEPALVRGVVDKTPRKPDPVERSKESYRDALALYRQGRLLDGNEHLRRALELDPRNVKARIYLATQYLGQGGRDEAEQLLAQGIELTPDNAKLAKFYARLLVAKGNVDKALSVLEDAQPDVVQDPEYHAFMAALYQRLGRHEEAVTAYRRVVEVRPDSGVWWMGLAISLEAMGDDDVAIVAYRKALNGHAMTADLQRYASERIAVLSMHRDS